MQQADHARPSAYLAIEPFKDVVRPDVTPVFMGESQVGQHLPYARQEHLYERLLHGRFPAPVALYDGGLERGQTQFRDGDVES